MNNFGRSKIVEILAGVIFVSSFIIFINVKPLGEYVELDNIPGEVTICFRGESATETDNGTFYQPEYIEISGYADNGTVKEILNMLSDTRVRRVKGRNSRLVLGANLETIYIIFYDEDIRNELFISNEHSIMYMTAYGGTYADKAFDVSDETFDNIKNILLKHSSVPQGVQ